LGKIQGDFKGETRRRRVKTGVGGSGCRD